MNSTDKMEMQVDEEQDGSAIALLPDSDKSLLPEFNEEDSQGKPELEYGADDDSNEDAVEDDEREALREARREERRLKKQIHREKTKESTHLISALKKRNDELAERLAIIEKKTSGAELARVDKAIEDAGVQVEYAKMKMQEAVTSSDGVALTRAQEMWFEAKRKM
jgi:predicted phage gp36 major capsid-like protein